MVGASVSVVIPCYNGESFLRETLESALKQSHAPSEIIVIDDGSTDRSADVAESFGAPVSVIRQENQGESVARNRGMDEASGEWIAFLDADDKWLREKLQRQLTSVSSDVPAICTGTRFFQTGIPADKTHEDWIPDESQFNSRWILTRGAPLHISSLLVRRGVPVRFPAWTQHGEDSLFLLELLRFGRIAVVDEPLTLYRRHKANQSRSKDAAIRWFESFEAWIDRKQSCSSEEQLASWRSELAELISGAATRAFWRRDWELYEHLTRYAASRPDVDWPTIPRKRFPAFMYGLKDGLDRWRNVNPMETT